MQRAGKSYSRITCGEEFGIFEELKKRVSVFIVLYKRKVMAL